jgi:hydroxyacylglutathione hydrolase
VRTDLQFDEAHIPDAISISARRAGFGSKLAWVAEPAQALVFVGRDDGDAREAAELASAVGLRDIAGVLAGGMTSWREEKLPVESVRRMTAGELSAAPDDVQLLDVRELSEWEDGHVPGSLHTPYHDLGRTLPEGLDEHRPVAVMCNSGPRAAVAASLLKRQGFDDVIHVVEGGVKDLLGEFQPSTK